MNSVQGQGLRKKGRKSTKEHSTLTLYTLHHTPHVLYAHSVHHTPYTTRSLRSLCTPYTTHHTISTLTLYTIHHTPHVLYAHSTLSSRWIHCLFHPSQSPSLSPAGRSFPPAGRSFPAYVSSRLVCVSRTACRLPPTFRFLREALESRDHTTIQE